MVLLSWLLWLLMGGTLGSDVDIIWQRSYESHKESRIKLAYGPFRVPSVNEDGGMKSFSVINATKPCDECLVTFIQAGLEYADGSYANVNTSMWLHHAVLYNLARNDTTCPASRERFFASGNERTALDLSLNGTLTAGYPLRRGDSIGLLVELMNEVEQPRDAIVTVEWRTLPHDATSGPPVTPVWLDVTGACSKTGSELSIPSADIFTATMSPPWTADFSGEVIVIGSHLHDGGVSLEVTKNNQTVCTAVATYGGTPGYVSPDGASAMGAQSGQKREMPMDIKHISSMPLCSNEGVTRQGDTWSAIANYNLTAHPPMMDANGIASPVMGISLLYIATEKDTT